jgi:hypothetical protein
MNKKSAFIALVKLSEKMVSIMANNAINVPPVVNDSKVVSE